MAAIQVPPRMTPEMEHFFTLMRAMERSKEPPPPEDYGKVGRYRGHLEAMADALLHEGLDGLKQEIARMFKDDPALALLYPTWEGSKGDQTQQKPKTLINLLDLLNRPPIAWVIEGVFYEDTILELYGEAGTFKSFLAFDWAARIATGTPWLGHATRKKGPVIYVAAEGAAGYQARILAWCKHNGITPQELAPNFYFWPEPLPLSDGAEITRFIEEASDALKESAQAPVLLVVDTLLRCSNAGNINQPDVMGALFKGADTMKRALKASNILIVHHAGKNAELGGMGSVVLKNNCDIIYSLKKDLATPEQVVLRAEKMKDKGAITIYVRSEKVYLGDPLDEDSTSLVIVAGERPGKENATPKLPKSQQNLLTILDTQTALAYGEWLKRYQEQGGRKSTFNSAREALLRANIIEEVDGKYRRRQEHPLQEKDEESDDE